MCSKHRMPGLAPLCWERLPLLLRAACPYMRSLNCDSPTHFEVPLFLHSRHPIAPIFLIFFGHIQYSVPPQVISDT